MQLGGLVLVSRFMSSAALDGVPMSEYRRRPPDDVKNAVPLAPNTRLGAIPDPALMRCTICRYVPEAARKSIIST